VSGTETETAALLQRALYFLYERGQWREKEPVGSRAWSLRREVLGEKHPYTISCMASLATTYHTQGRYNKAGKLHDEALGLRREVLEEKHPDTIQSMEYLISTQEALQQLPPLTESVQSLTMTKVEETEVESKTRCRSLWKVYVGRLTSFVSRGSHDRKRGLN
jgi:hypothetical protein